jgi:hypothetical protein
MQPLFRQAGMSDGKANALADQARVALRTRLPSGFRRGGKSR